MVTGPHTNYPRQLRPPPGVNFSLIGEGLGLLWANRGVYLLGGLMLLIPGLIFASAGILAYWYWMFEPAEGDFWQLLYADLIFQGVFSLVYMIGYALTGPTSYSLSAITFKILRGQEVSTADLLLGWKRPLPPLLLAFLLIFLVQLGAMCCYLPGFILGGLFLLALPLMVEQGLGPVGSLRASWEKMKDHWLIAAAFYFVITLLQGLGVIVLLVGLLYTLPLVAIWVTLLYRDFDRPTDTFTPVPPGPPRL